MLLTTNPKRRINMSLSDYSSLEKEISNAPEPKILPKGSEVKARIITVRNGISEKNGAQWYSVVFDIPSEPLAREFNGFFWDLADLSKLEEKAGLGALRGFKNFASAFGVDYSKPFSWEDDLIGLEGWVILGVKKSDEYEDQNTVSKYLRAKK